MRHKDLDLLTARGEEQGLWMLDAQHAVIQGRDPACHRLVYYLLIVEAWSSFTHRE